jgi:hypothetical protein
MAELREALAAAGYTTDAVQKLLHVKGELSSRPADLQVHDRRTRDASRLATLVRLLALGLEAEEVAVATALAPLKPARLAELGLLEVEAGRVRALARLAAHGELHLASDMPGAGGANQVTGVNSPTVLLAQLAVRRRVDRMLDLGTGNGIQGLLCAAHCQHVVSTDVNPRALAFAEFNAALNGITNLETRLGSLYEPLDGERFGLILSNPPYVISPESALVYRDSGLGPGEICRDVIHGAGVHLEDGGYAQALVSWPLRAGRPWDEPLRAWVPEATDAWLLHYQTEDPLTHASKWTQPNDNPGVQARGEVLDAWLSYYHREEVDQIGFGAVFLHRRPGAGQVISTEARRADGGAGRQVQRVFSALAAGDLDDKQVGASVFTPVPEQQIEQASRPLADGSWAAADCTVRLVEGVGSEGTLDMSLVRVLTLLNGRLSLDKASAKAATQLGLKAGELREPARAMARGLYRLGFLTRAQDPPAAG